MPELSKLIEKKIQRLDQVPNEFIKAVGKSQKQIWEELLVLLDSLDRKNGEIITSVKNIDLIDDILIDLQKVVKGSEYVEAVKEFAKEFDQQAILNESIVASSFEGLTVEGISTAILKQTKRNAIDLFVGGALDKELYNPIRLALTDAVSSGKSVKDTLKGLRIIVEGGGDVTGKLERYAKQITHDTFAISDASYTNALAEEIGAEFYRYVGGTIDDTRQFCKEKNGKYFTKKEIEGWADDKWDGKYKGTDVSTIFIYRGGYNCRHYLIPVSELTYNKNK